MLETDKQWMGIALEEAAKALELDEVPVGACLVDENHLLLGSNHNLTITENDPTAHAEMLVLREASRRVGNYRLTGTTIYTTIEPCAMCAGALVNARVKRLVYGAEDERFGAVRSHFGVCDSEILNHKIAVEAGVLADECRLLMQEFFRARRADR